MHTELFMNTHLQYYYFYWILNYTQELWALMDAGDSEFPSFLIPWLEELSVMI